MPLYVRLRNDHYPHDEPSTLLDYYVVLSGGLEVGGFHRIGSGPSKGRWSWGAKICTDDTTYTAGGYAAYPDVCCTLIGRHAVIGLSRPRRNKTFEGLALDERLAAKDAVPRCGLYVVDIDEHTIDELYDVAVLPGVRQAEAVGFVRGPPARDQHRGLSELRPLARRVRKAFSLPGCRRSPRTAPALPPAPSRRAAPGRKSRCASRAAPGVRPRPGRAPWRHASRSAPP